MSVHTSDSLGRRLDDFYKKVRRGRQRLCDSPRLETGEPNENAHDVLRDEAENLWCPELPELLPKQAYSTKEIETLYRWVVSCLIGIGELTDEGRSPDDDDYRTVGDLAARLRQHGQVADERDAEARIKHFAEIRAQVGAFRFDLAHELREPANAMERDLRDHACNLATDEEIKARHHRPVDEEMLITFFDTYMDRLKAYAGMRQTIVEIAMNQTEFDAWRRLEPSVDGYVVRMRRDLPMWNTEVSTVIQFLTELRAEKHGIPVKVGNHVGPNAHQLLQHVLNLSAENWELNKETAERSRTDSRYIRSTTASHLAFEAWVQDFPSPQELGSLLELEQNQALKELRQRKERIAVAGKSKSVEGCDSGGNHHPDRPKDSTRHTVAAVLPQIREYLEDNPGLTQRDLAKLMGCSLGLVNKAVAQLRKRTVPCAQGGTPETVADYRLENARKELEGLNARFEAACSVPKSPRGQLKASQALLEEYRQLAEAYPGCQEATLRWDEVKQIVQQMQAQQSEVIEQRNRRKVGERS